MAWIAERQDKALHSFIDRLETTSLSENGSFPIIVYLPNGLRVSECPENGKGTLALGVLALCSTSIVTGAFSWGSNWDMGDWRILWLMECC